jgi:MoaA/NifB/PqqE/SkfB family radical SAM enzyme
MGFPKPWPTEWPDPIEDSPADQPDRRPDRTPDDTGTDEEQPTMIPEYRQRFYSVTWAVNHVCNLRCTHCYDVVPFSRHDLSTEQALTVVDRLHETGVTFIAFSGGEAFLRKDLLQLMGRAKAHGIQFGARSNGTRITDAVATRLAALKIGVVGVSFDGATPETHDAVRGPGAFLAALAGLKALVAHGIRAQMEVVLSRQNMHEAREFIVLGEAVGAAEVNFSAMTPQGRGKARMEDLLDHTSWQQVTTTLRSASQQAPIPVSPNCALLGPCYANIEPHITCDGWMSPCYLSTIKLFSVLDTAPDDIRAHLERTRRSVQDICGRGAWVRTPEPSSAMLAPK